MRAPEALSDWLTSSFAQPGTQPLDPRSTCRYSGACVVRTYIDLGPNMEQEWSPLKIGWTLSLPLNGHHLLSQVWSVLRSADLLGPWCQLQTMLQHVLATAYVSGICFSVLLLLLHAAGTEILNISLLIKPSLGR